MSAPPLDDLEEIKLVHNVKERQLYDNLADLFSIIITTEHLETAYVRDCVKADEYSKECSRLIAQYKTLRDAVQEVVPNIEGFMGEYKMSCKAAANRLLVKGVPATVEHGGVAEKDKGEELAVFHAVQHFITTMDSLKLEMRAVDELHPHLSDLMDSINKVANLPPEHESKTKVKEWLLRLNKMRAHDELGDEDVRQMSFDLENAYNAFHKFLKEK